MILSGYAKSQKGRKNIHEQTPDPPRRVPISVCVYPLIKIVDKNIAQASLAF